MAILATVGLADSAYLVLRFFDLLGPTSAIAATSCGFAAGSCERVNHSQAAVFLGVPTALWGVAYFGFVILIATVKEFTGKWPLGALLPFAFAGGLAFSAYMVYILLFDLRAPCPFCLTAHALNAVVVALYAASRLPRRLHHAPRGRWAANTG